MEVKQAGMENGDFPREKEPLPQSGSAVWVKTLKFRELRRDIAQQVKVLAGLAEDQDEVPSNHTLS